MKIAKVYYDVSLYNNAVQYAERCLEVDPLNAEAILLKAKSYYELKLYDKSKKECELLLQLEISNNVRKAASELLKKVERSENETNTSDKENDNTPKSQPYSSKYSSTENYEKVDNRKFFGSFNNDDERTQYSNSDNNDNFKPSDRRQTQYSFSGDSAKSNSHFKENIGKPKRKEATKTYQQQQDEMKAHNKNNEACKDLKAKRYDKAIKLYSDAIALVPLNAVYLTNRSACYMEMQKYDLASADALKAIEADASFWKAYSRAINCFLALGNIRMTEFYIARFESNVAGVESIKFNEIPKLESLKQSHENIQKFYDENNFHECLKCLESALKVATACINYQNLKIEVLVLLEKYDEADVLIDKA